MTDQRRQLRQLVNLQSKRVEAAEAVLREARSKHQQQEQRQRLAQHDVDQAKTKRETHLRQSVPGASVQLQDLRNNEFYLSRLSDQLVQAQAQLQKETQLLAQFAQAAQEASQLLRLAQARLDALQSQWQRLQKEHRRQRTRRSESQLEELAGAKSGLTPQPSRQQEATMTSVEKNSSQANRAAMMLSRPANAPAQQASLAAQFQALLEGQSPASGMPRSAQENATQEQASQNQCAAQQGDVADATASCSDESGDDAEQLASRSLFSDAFFGRQQTRLDPDRSSGGPVKPEGATNPNEPDNPNEPNNSKEPFKMESRKSDSKADDAAIGDQPLDPAAEIDFDSVLARIKKSWGQSEEEGESGDTLGSSIVLNLAVTTPQTAPVPSESPWAVLQQADAKVDVLELMDRHVRQLLANEAAGKSGSGGQVLLRLADASLFGADLSMVRTASGWSLRASGQDPRGLSLIRQEAPRLIAQFARRGLGTLEVDTVDAD